MKKRNQLLAFLLTGVIGLSALTGCSPSGAESQSTQGSAAESTPGQVSQETQPSQGTETAAPEDNKLVVALYTHANITDYDDNYFTRHLEEQTGIDLEFYLLPSTKDEANTKISLLATSGEDLPDVLITSTLSDEVIYSYGQSGLFLPLNEYVYDASAMPNYNSMPEDVLALMNQASTQADGNIYSVGKYLPADWNLATCRSWINTAWLEKLNLEIPETTEQLKEVLIAFRDQDPNGNGMKDEIPMYAQISSSRTNNALVYLMNSFVFYNGKEKNGGLALNEDGTQVIAPFVTEEWREGLRYMKELYDEELLSPSAFTDDATQFKATLNLETNVVGFVSSSSYGNWTDYDNNPNLKEMAMLKPLVGPEGVSYAAYADYVPGQYGFIFSATEKVDLAVKFLDAFFDTDTDLISRYGEEGVDWTRDPDVLSGLKNWRIEAGIYDSMVLATMLDLYASPTNKQWRDLNPGYRSNEIIGANCNINDTTYDPELVGNWAMEYHYLNYLPAHPEYILPVLKYTEADTVQIQDALTSIPDFVMLAMSEFVTGARDIESGWDTYLNELESMGLEKWLETAQATYERTLQ